LSAAELRIPAARFDLDVGGGAKRFGVIQLGAELSILHDGTVRFDSDVGGSAV
jgi:hypothetical protein